VTGTSVSVTVTVRGDNPFSAEPGHPGYEPVAFIETGDALIVLKTPAQADSLIRAAVAAKDMLLAATALASTTPAGTR
jgi:hypothetical protein